MGTHSRPKRADPRLGRPISGRDEIVVFWIVSDSACAECGEELEKGRFLRMEAERPLCLRCDLAIFSQGVGALFPGCPIEEQRAIAEHACEKYSGRIGRSPAAKALQPGAIELAVRAHVRRIHTEHDELLARGVAREEARARVAASVAKCLEGWQRGRT